jgi:hypothetical protein
MSAPLAANPPANVNLLTNLTFISGLAPWQRLRG